MSNPHNPAQSDASVEHDPTGTIEATTRITDPFARDFDRFPTQGQPRLRGECTWSLNSSFTIGRQSHSPEL